MTKLGTEELMNWKCKVTGILAVHNKELQDVQNSRANYECSCERELKRRVGPCSY
jgi:hypothetical protein